MQAQRAPILRRTPVLGACSLLTGGLLVSAVAAAQSMAAAGTKTSRSAPMRVAR